MLAVRTGKASLVCVPAPMPAVRPAPGPTAGNNAGNGEGLTFRLARGSVRGFAPAIGTFRDSCDVCRSVRCPLTRRSRFGPGAGGRTEPAYSRRSCTTRRNAAPADSLKCGRHPGSPPRPTLTVTRHPRPAAGPRTGPQDRASAPSARTVAPAGPPVIRTKAQRGAASGARGAGVFMVGLDGCEVLLCDPCARVRPCPGSPGVFLPYFYRYRYFTGPVYDVKRISFCPTRYWLTVAVASSRGGRLSTGHLSFVRSTRRQPPRSMPGQRPVSGLVQSDGDRRPSRSTDGSQYPRLVPSVRFAAWSSSAPLARGPGSRDVGVLLAQAASSSAQRQWLHSQGRKPSTRLAPAPCSTRGPS